LNLPTEVLKLWPLEADLTEVYKMMHELSSVPVTTFSSLLLTVINAVTVAAFVAKLRSCDLSRYLV